MARRKYVKGALIEARNSKYGKGFGMIVSDAVEKHSTVHGWWRERTATRMVQSPLV